MAVQRSLVDPAELAALLRTPDIRTARLCDEDDIRRETHSVAMRDGVKLATDVYLPPRLPAPTVVRRTPYGRSTDVALKWILPLATRGFVVVTQDCRGTGDSEPDVWDYYVFESEDSLDCVEWITRQRWFDGFIAACGASYAAQTQWCMARHPAMSTIVPEVSGLGLAWNTAAFHMFLNAYARGVGKGSGVGPAGYDDLEADLLEETLATGLFNEPITPAIAARAQRELWRRYCDLPSRERRDWIKSVRGVDRVTIGDIEAMPSQFGQRIAHDAHTIPTAQSSELVRSLRAPPLMITGWYDWGLNDALATWKAVVDDAGAGVRDRARLIITPSAHKTPGYHEGAPQRPELRHNHRVVNHIDLLLRWFDAIRYGGLEQWPRVIYYMMNAGQWRTSDTWPPANVQTQPWYLSQERHLTRTHPQSAECWFQYVYDPLDPTPTVGGSIVSAVLPPGSVDLEEVQRRPDVLTWQSEPLQHDVYVAGSLKAFIYASSSAQDTDFVVRLSDVFPDGRVIQLQNGLLRTRHSNPEAPQPLTPGEIYRLQIDMWATANCFRAGHRICIDISSADFPRFDRNSNLAGEGEGTVRAVQTIYCDASRPSHVLLPVLPE
jgi:putative CocE/NonD family hydrolase